MKTSANEGQFYIFFTGKFRRICRRWN